MNLALKYAFFAVLAMIANILTQYLSLGVYNGVYGLYAAIIFGTLVGLFIKYLLDKKYIFYYQMKNKKEDFVKFIFYSAMGVITTVIFWSTEIAFDSFLNYGNAKFIGAAVGLSIGYFIKYHLDKRFVFIK